MEGGPACEAYLPRCTVGSRQAEHKSQGVDGRGRYGNEVGNSLRMRGDEPMRREGLQARGIYKEVPRPSRGLALATRQKIPYTTLRIGIFFDYWRKSCRLRTRNFSIYYLNLLNSLVFISSRRYKVTSHFIIF